MAVSPTASPFPGVPSMAVFDSVMFTFFGLAIVTTGLRLFVRSRILRVFGLDDYLAIAATVRPGAEIVGRLACSSCV